MIVINDAMNDSTLATRPVARMAPTTASDCFSISGVIFPTVQRRATERCALQDRRRTRRGLEIELPLRSISATAGAVAKVSATSPGNRIVLRSRHAAGNLRVDANTQGRLLASEIRAAPLHYGRGEGGVSAQAPKA